MIRINVHEAKAHLSRYLDAAEKGESVVICRRNVPIAELRAIGHPSLGDEPRPWGIDRGKVSVPADFNAPLSEEELRAWEGDSGS